MIEVRRLGPQIGAEIHGIDVKTVDETSFAAIYRAWLDYNVVVVPGQELQIEDFLDAEYRHRWRRGDIVIWDNRCSYHKAAGDYPPEEDRIHGRVSIKEHGGAKGERP